MWIAFRGHDRTRKGGTADEEDVGVRVREAGLCSLLRPLTRRGRVEGVDGSMVWDGRQRTTGDSDVLGDLSCSGE